MFAATGAKSRREKKTASARGLLENKSKVKLPERCRYCFGGVLAGAVGLLAAGVAGLLVAGFTGLGAVLDAAGAGTLDCAL
jgi:hypothetical protein